MNLGISSIVTNDTNERSTELSDVSFLLQNNVTTQFSEYVAILERTEELCKGIETLETVIDVIKTKGVSDAFFNTFGESIYVNFDLDLSRLIGKSPEECTAAVESLGSMMKSFYEAVINFFKKIIDWIKGFSRTWTDTNERYKHRINRLNRHLMTDYAKINTDAFLDTEINGRPYPNYKTMAGAVVNMIVSFKSLSMSNLENINIRNTFGSDLIKCGYTFTNNGEMVPPAFDTYRCAKARDLFWTAARVYEFRDILVTNILSHNEFMQKLEKEFAKKLSSSIAECENILKANKSGAADILQKQQCACRCLKHILGYMLKTTSGLSFQYIHMVNRFSYK